MPVEEISVLGGGSPFFVWAIPIIEITLSPSLHGFEESLNILNKERFSLSSVFQGEKGT